MFREIKKKQVILENRKPYKRDVADYIAEMNLVDWVYSSMRLDGSALDRSDVSRMLKGEFIIDATIHDHTSVEGYYNAIRYAYDILGMGSDINERVVFELYQFLACGPAQYRKGNPVLLSFAYNPPHPSEVPEQMQLLLGWLYSEEYETNPLMKAACLHNRFLEIYPFEEHCEAMARFLMYYYIMSRGYPPFALNLSEQEYNQIVITFLKEYDSMPFYRAVERALYNKMEIMMQLTARE